MYNTINKIARRTCSELEGLSMAQLEQSYITNNTSVTITPSCVDTTDYNKISKISRRTYGEINLLKVHVIEKSYRTNDLTTENFKIIKPLKLYTNKLKMLKKYTNKIKY